MKTNNTHKTGQSNMKKYLLISLLSALSFGSSAAIYKAKINVIENEQSAENGQSERNSNTISKVSLILEGGKESSVLSMQTIPYIKDAQPKIDFWDGLFFSNYEYGILELGTSYNVTVYPTSVNNIVSLHFDYQNTSLIEIKELETDEKIMQLPKTSSHNLSSRSIKINIDENNGCKIISSHKNQSKETIISICLKKLG